MEKQRRRDARGIVGKVAAVVFAAGFVLSIVPAIRALAEGTIFKIQSAEITEISTGATGSINTYDEQTIVSNVTFHKINDSISYKIVLQNSDNKDHIIESITDDNASEIIDYIYNAHAGETVTAGADLDFLLTAKYANGVTDTSKRAEVSNVKFFIKFTDVEEPEEIDIVVPNTGKNTAESNGAGISLATMIISVIGLTILAIIAIKKHKKYAKIIGVAVVAVSAFGLATTAKAANIETNSFTLTTNYGLYDKLVIKNGDDNVIIDYGDKLEDAGEITNPTKPGYIFSGWQDEDSNDIDPTNPIYEDLTIKPKFTAISYKVRFNANGGAGEMADQTFTYDEAANLTANAFTYTGRAYAGWDTEANGSGVHYDDAQSVKNLTTVDNGVVNLYAQWSINPYYINYNANGGEGEMATTNCEYDEDCQLRANAFTKYGYDFAGWKNGDQTFTDGQIVRNLIEQGTITLEAQWTPTEYEIHYDGITDEERFALSNPTTYTIETPAFQLHNPADRKDDDGDTVQVFVGWQETTTYPIIVLPNTNNLGTKTYKAIWESYPFPRYAITYNLGGGNVATANPTTHDKTESFTLNEPTKTGYTFTGWTGTTIEGSTPVMNYTLPAPHIRDAIEFTAHYRKNTYTINFDGNNATSGATASMSMTYDEAQDLTANGFARTGYIFAGWKYNNEDYTDGAEVTNLTTEDGATVTLKAQWAPIHYNVAFHQNADNVSGNMPSMTVAYDESTPLTENTFALEHYKFMGWNSAEDGTGTPYEDKASIKNLTATDGATVDLYAQWKERTATLNTGANVRTALKGLADAPTTFKKYDGENLPDFDTLDSKVDIALADSNFPVWAWVDDDNIYWWSEAERPNFNSNSSTMFQSMTTLTTIDLDGLESSTAVNMSYLFNGCTSLTSLDISEFNTANVQNMMAMFYNTPALTSINTAVLNTANVNNMSFMFRDTGATSIDISNFNTVNVKTMQSMFENTKASSITLGNPNTLNVTNMANMFQDTLNITSLDVSGLDTDNVESMGGMFEAFKGTPKLTSLDLSNFKTGKVRNFQAMFYGQANLTNLDVSNFDTSSATTMYMMFLGMSKVQSINVSGWTNDQGPVMEYMFSYTGTSGTVINFDNFNTENVTNMNHMFSDMRSQTVLDLSSFDTAKVKNMSGMFSASYASTPMALKTVYVSDKFVTTALTGTQNNIFDHTRAIVGGAGTAWDASSMEKARIDDPDNSEPGYFTMKGARYIRYNGNGADNATPYGAMRSEYLKAGDSLKKNAFTRSGYEFAGWKDADGNDYTDEQVMAELVESKTPLELYAQWIEKIATFDTGANFNAKIKTLAAGTDKTSNDVDDIITGFKHYEGTPDESTLEDAIVVSTDDSTSEIYAWLDNENALNWWTDTDKVYVNEDAGFMFTNLTALTSFDTTKFNTENTVSMESFLYKDISLPSIDFLNDLNTSNVQNMKMMVKKLPGVTGDVVFRFDTKNVTTMEDFASEMSNVNSVDFSHLNTSKVRNMLGLCFGMTNATSINLSGLDTSQNENFYYAFGQLKNITELDLSSFDTSKVKKMQFMFTLSNKLETIYVSDKFVTTAVNDSGHRMFEDASKLVGSAGSRLATYWSQTNVAYARIDDLDNGEIGYFTPKGARYIRYNGNGADNATPYGAMTSEYLKAGDSLKKNAFVRDGYVFNGWKDADNNEYTDEQVMTGLTESKTPLTLYAQWEAEPAVDLTFYNITSMQQMTADICATATTPNTNASQFDTTGENVGNKSYIPRRELIDNRDGKSYQVTKLADGKCWMTENLALGDPDSTMTLTPNDSDVSSNFTLPKSDINAFAGSSDVSAVYVDDTFGGYYSVKTANLDFTEYGKSICPKGWRLPSAYSSGDWDKLERGYSIENGTSDISALYDEPFNYTHSFYVSNRRISNYYETVYIGPATGSSSFSNFGVYIPDNYTGTTGISGSEGGSIRCVAR